MIRPEAVDSPSDSPTFPSCTIPEVPPERGYESSATVQLHARYEDIAQDGRMQLTPIMPGLGAVWRALGSSEKLDSFREQGILPILRRVVIVGEQGETSIEPGIEVEKS